MLFKLEFLPFISFIFSTKLTSLFGSILIFEFSNFNSFVLIISKTSSLSLSLSEFSKFVLQFQISKYFFKFFFFKIFNIRFNINVFLIGVLTYEYEFFVYFENNHLHRFSIGSMMTSWEAGGLPHYLIASIAETIE